MNITEVRVKILSNRQDKLQAFCSVTLDDDFVIRDLKIIEGNSGPFVAMPSRKLADKCGRCSTKNHLRAKFCNECGGKLASDRSNRDAKGRSKLHVDIAHPINPECREALQAFVLEAYIKETKKSREEGYTPISDKDLDVDEVVAGFAVKEEDGQDEYGKDLNDGYGEELDGIVTT